MSEKNRIRYTYDSIEAWEEFDPQVSQIIKDETGEDFWISTRNLPPTAYPPELSTSCIEQIKALDGRILVAVLDDD